MARNKTIIGCATTGAINSPSRQGRSNTEQVTETRCIVKELGCEVTTPHEAPEILDLKLGDGVSF